MENETKVLTHDQVLARHLAVLKQWERQAVEEIASKQQGLASIRVEIQKIVKQTEGGT